MDDLEQLYHQQKERALQAGQAHIFRFWDQLSASQKRAFIKQIAEVDFDMMNRLAEKLISTKAHQLQRPRLEPIQPLPVPRTREQVARAREAEARGEAALRAGKIGAILVAGGQGTRLGHDGPKGVYAIGPVSCKSLFQLHAEKLLAMNRRYQTRIPWYIMTSEANHRQTRSFFQKHQFFGLPPEDVYFFPQGMMPALDAAGKLVLEARGQLSANPDGHGGVFRALERSGAVRDMQERGIEQLFYFQVDNVLIKICDPVFIGYHLGEAAEMSAKVCAKRDPFEKVGVVGKLDGKLGVIEYSDLSDEDKQARDASGKLLFNAGSIAVHILSLAFIQSVICAGDEFPWHVAHKKIPVVDSAGETMVPETPNAYKFEKFIFDALRFVERSVILEVERELEFSPVKNAEGEDSPETARRDMTRYFARWLAAAGFELPENLLEEGGRIEISPLYALDEKEFVKKVNGTIKFDRGLYIG